MVKNLANSYKMHKLNIPKEVIDKVKCPKCGFLFSKMQSKTIACMGCSKSVIGDCGFVRCPRCDYEIPDTINKEFAIKLKNYYDQFGWSYKR